MIRKPGFVNYITTGYLLIGLQATPMEQLYVDAVNPQCKILLSKLNFATLETRRELETKCVPQLFLGSILSLVTVPEVSAKVNSIQIPSKGVVNC